MEQYLITGGSGFIGSHIAEELVARGHRVRILDNLSSGYRRNIAHLESSVEFMEGDIRDRATLSVAMQGVRYVFHEAALVSVFESVEQPEENHAINITGTLKVLQAAVAAGAQRLVMASSAAIYGNNPDLPKTTDMRPEPESPYAVGKITGEYYLRIFASLYELETIALRYFNVFGPRQDPTSMYSGVISKFSDVLRAGDTPKIFGDGLQTRDFVYVKDVVQANIKAMHDKRVGAGEVFNVGTGKQTSLLELLDTLANLLGRTVEPEFHDARAGDIRDSVSDISQTRAVLNYDPAYNLSTGLKELLEWTP